MQFVTLAVHFDHHRITVYFDAQDANPPLGSADFNVVTDAESDIVDDGQPVAGRTVSALQDQRAYIASRGTGHNLGLVWTV
jgi:hypothetical protein